MINHLTPNFSQTTVFFDGTCPLCLAEVGYYETIDKSGSLCLVDVSNPEFSRQDLVQQKTAMQRFHVLSSDGRLLSGAPAFVVVWQGLPRWRMLAKVFAFPGLTVIFELVYRIFLLLRPLTVRIFIIVQRLRRNSVKHH